MKLCDPSALSALDTPAPALSRGLAVMATLAQQTSCTLEGIARQLGLPKASVYRLLNTLERSGVVRRTPDKHYEPLWSLQPLADRGQLFREILAPRMDALCQSVECTVEWYEPVAEGMKLVLQKHPATELYVHAKPGFIRDWTTEFEAVTRLAHAFSAEAPALTRIETYATNGRMETLDKTTIKNLIKAAREDPIAYDRAYNSRGVRRFAAAGFDHDTGEWLGVLAIAEGYHFFRKTQPQAYLKSLKATLNPN